jgi:hypothetical protein
MFELMRISPGFVKALQDFGNLALDLFWESDQIGISWTEDKIQEYFFSNGKSEFQDFPKDLMLSILREGCDIFNSFSFDKCFKDNLLFVESIHFLLAGKHGFYRHAFIVKEVFPVISPANEKPITLVNVLVGKHEIKNEADVNVSYLTAIEVEEAVNVFPKILNDNLELRWKMLQELDQDLEYFPPLGKDSNWSAEMIDLVKQSRRELEERLRRSFSERFGRNEDPRQFLQDVLFPFLLEARQRGCGVLLFRFY